MFHVIGSITDAARGSEATRTHPVSIVAAPIGWVGGPGLPTGAATVVGWVETVARDRVDSASLRFIPVKRELFPADVKLFSSSRISRPHRNQPLGVLGLSGAEPSRAKMPRSNGGQAGQSLGGTISVDLG